MFGFSGRVVRRGPLVLNGVWHLFNEAPVDTSFPEPFCFLSASCSSSVILVLLLAGIRTASGVAKQPGGGGGLGQLELAGFGSTVSLPGARVCRFLDID